MRFAACGRKHFQDESAELQIPPLRYAPVGMTKVRVALSVGMDLWRKEQQVPAVSLLPI
jgi:hypothetical protein